MGGWGSAPFESLLDRIEEEWQRRGDASTSETMRDALRVWVNQPADLTVAEAMIGFSVVESGTGDEAVDQTKAFVGNAERSAKAISTRWRLPAQAL